MGKFKVSFTTALFVFSFIICVIVAVIFVDRSPRNANDYDAFYDSDKKAGNTVDPADAEKPKWIRQKEGLATPAPTATVAAVDPMLMDLPIDPSLMGSAQQVPSTPATPMGSPNAMQGKSPEEIARMLMHRGMPTAAPAVPGMAMPSGIATPAAAPVVTPPPSAMPSTGGMHPVQSNVGSGAGSAYMPGRGQAAPPVGNTYQLPSLGTSNTGGNTWNPVADSTPPSTIGVRTGPAQPDSGMMISRGQNELNVAAPDGFTNEPTRDGSATPNASLPPMSTQLPTGPAGIQSPSPSSQQQLLLAPMPSGTPVNKYNLPPAPTLRPPMVQDPDRRRSDSDTAPTDDPNPPGGAIPDESPDQAVSVSATPASPENDKPGAPKAIAVRVNDVELPQDEAERLAQAKALMTKKPLTQDNRKAQVADAVAQWTAITAAAEEARAKDIQLAPDEVDKYAAMHPDLDVAQWKTSLAESGFTPDQISERITDIALSEKLVEHQAEEKYPEKELRKIYEKSPKKYNSPRKVQVLEIFKKKPEDEAKATKVAQAMKRLQRQAASGIDFGLLAQQASEAESPASATDGQWLTPSEAADDPMAKAVTDLKPGEVSAVVEGDDGYRIVKVTEEQPARDDFDGGKNQILENLKKDLRTETLADAKKEQKIEIEPKGQLITKKSEKPKEEVTATKADTPKDTKEKPKAEVAEKPKAKLKNYAQPAERPTEAAASTPAPPSGPTVQSMPVTAAAQSGPASPQPMASGQPAPPNPPGQTPSPVMGYTPGATITVGNGQQNLLNPAASTTVNYPPGTAVQSNGVANPNDPAVAQEARTMQARAEAEAAARQQALDYEVQQARAGANPNATPAAAAPGAPAAAPVDPAQGTLNMTATIRPNPLRLPGAPASTVVQPGQDPRPNQPTVQRGQVTQPFNMAQGQPTTPATAPAQPDIAEPAVATPVISQSNGWTVSKTELEPTQQQPQRPMDDPNMGAMQQGQQAAQATPAGSAPPRL